MDRGPLLRQFGAVDGSRPNVDLLMANKQNVLVYPGGGQEIMKPKSAMKYELMWKERLGFARMAIKNRYPIMPCACVGNEDMLDIIFDLPMNFLKGSVSITSLPVAAPNSLQKIYFWFGEPISTEEYGGDADNTDFAREVRDKAKAAIEKGGVCVLKKRLLPASSFCHGPSLTSPRARNFSAQTSLNPT